MRNQSIRLLFVAGFVVFLSAFEVSCNGGDYQFSGRFFVEDESPYGIFFGQITTTVGANPVSTDVTAIVSEQGDVQFMLPIDAQRHYAGTVRVDGTRISGTLTEYRGAFGRFLGIDEIAPATLDGTVSTADSLSGNYASALEDGRFMLDYQPSYVTDSSLNLTAGVWSFDMAAAGGGVYTVTWDIDANGAVFGADTNGCVFSGDISLIDTRYNAYRVSIDVTACGAINGEYSGLAYLEAVGGAELNRLTVGVSSDVSAFATILQK